MCAVNAASLSCWAVADHVTKGKGDNADEDGDEHDEDDDDDDEDDDYHYDYDVYDDVMVNMNDYDDENKSPSLHPFQFHLPSSFNSSQHFQWLQPNSSTLGASASKYAVSTISDADMSGFRTHKQQGVKPERVDSSDGDCDGIPVVLLGLVRLESRKTAKGRMFGPVSLRIPKPPQKHQLSFDCLSKEFKALQYVAVVVLRVSSLRWEIQYV